MATELQLEIAAKLKELGSQKAVVEFGYNKGTVSKIAKKLRKGWKPEEETFGNVETASPAEASEGGPLQSKKVVGRAIEVGRITITPENWGLTQYGAILILDTYNKTKRDINYGGTMGDFLCDMCEFYRRVLNYKEVEYSKAIGEGGGGAEENSSESPQH